MYMKKEINAMNKRIREDHGNHLPTIRIAKIELNHFKSVNHGEITMNCGKKHIPYGTRGDIPLSKHVPCGTLVDIFLSMHVF